MGSILITGAATGFGREVALRLVREGHDVIAGVEIQAQIFELEEAAKRDGAKLRVEKIDVTDEADRKKVADWDIDAVLHNAGISEGGSIADVPAENMRRQYEVNVIGPVLLTQEVIRPMVKKGKGMIVFMSSVAGLTTDPFAGVYSSSKHAVEAVAEALRQEVAEFGITVATINPGPFLTGFNDRMFETWKTWRDDPSRRLFDYDKVSFPHAQHDITPVVETTVGVLTGKIDTYRNVEPKSIIPQQRKMMEDVWTRKYAEGVGERADLVDKALQMKPGTPV